MKILVADDEATNRRLLEFALGKWGYEVMITSDGEQAWEVLQREDAPPLAILDWMMPGIDGVELCRKVRALSDVRLTYIIMLTTKSQRGDVVMGLQAGADDYVVKPFDPEELRARIQVGERMLALQQTLAERGKELAVAHARLIEQERFNAAVSAMSDGIVVVDGNWRITLANRAACLLLNLPREGWEGTSLADAFQPFTLSESLPELQASRERSVAFEVGRLNTQPPLCLDARLTRLLNAANVMESAVLTLRDVTAEHHAHRLRSNFFMLVSHKLRTPLTILSGYLNLCQRLPSERLTEEWEGMIEVCEIEVRQLQEMVEKLLEFKALGTQQMEVEAQPTDVAAVVVAAFEEMRRRYPSRSLEMTSDVAADATLAAASDKHIATVMEKLLDNAVKFGDKDPVRIHVKVERKQEWLQFSVSDNGQGIPHEYYDRVLEGFVQVEDHVTGQVPGLGAGLSIARQVIQAYEGNISIQSRIGEGTTVSFTLPAA